MKKIILGLVTIASISASASPDVTCVGKLNKKTTIKISKDEYNLEVEVFKKRLLRRDLVRKYETKIAFRQGLSSDGPYVGYQNKAYGSTYVLEEQRKRATIHYSYEAQLIIPWDSIPGTNDLRDSIFQHDEATNGKKIKMKCSVLRVG